MIHWWLLAVLHCKIVDPKGRSNPKFASWPRLTTAAVASDILPSTPACLSVHLSVRPSVRPPACLPACLSGWLAG